MLWNMRRAQPIVVTNPAPIEPHWMSLAEWQTQRSPQLAKEGWVVAAPTPEGAQDYLREGWELDKIDGRQVIMGGRLGAPAHWSIRRRAQQKS